MPVETNSPALKKLLDSKGQIRTVTFKRPLKFKAEFKNLSGYKLSTIQVRCGIKYDNLKAVKDQRETGALPSKNHGLNGKTWMIYPYVLLSSQKKVLFRFYKVHSTVEPMVKYYIGEEEVTKDKVGSFCLSSEVRERDSGIDMFEAGIETVMDVK